MVESVNKGIIDIEFIMAVFVFLSSVVFVTFAIGREFFSIREASVSETMNVRSAIVLQVLLLDKGEPVNWWDSNIPITSIKRLGLSSENRQVLDIRKVNRLRGFCDLANPDYAVNYNKIKDLLGIEGNIILTIKAIDGQVFLDCKPATESLLRPKFTAEGYAVIGSEKKIVNFKTIVVI